MRATAIHPKLDELFNQLHLRLGLDPATLPKSPLRGRRPTVGVSQATAMKLWELQRIIDVVCSYSAMINRGRVRAGKSRLEFVGVDLSAGLGAYHTNLSKVAAKPLSAALGGVLKLLEK